MTGALTRFRNGDAEALDEVVDAYVRPAFAAAVAVLGDRALAERAVREAFADAADAVESFDPAEQSEAAWLLSRVRVHAIRLHRKSRPSRHTLEADPDTVWRSVMTAIGVEEGQAAFATLTDAQREVLALAFWKGVPPATIATMRGIPEEMVREALRTGLGRYRDAVARTTREPVR